MHFACSVIGAKRTVVRSDHILGQTIPISRFKYLEWDTKSFQPRTNCRPTFRTSSQVNDYDVDHLVSHLGEWTNSDRSSSM
jgi:hypothetical protein